MLSIAYNQRRKGDWMPIIWCKSDVLLIHSLTFTVVSMSTQVHIYTKDCQKAATFQLTALVQEKLQLKTNYKPPCAGYRSSCWWSLWVTCLMWQHFYLQRPPTRKVQMVQNNLHCCQFNYIFHCLIMPKCQHKLLLFFLPFQAAALENLNNPLYSKGVIWDRLSSA